MNIDYYLLFIFDDVEPHLHGPFPTQKSRDEKAKQLRHSEGEQHGYFPIEITKGCKVSINSYSGVFFEE